MLKDARASAEEELKAFRLKEEERFKVEVEQVRKQLHVFAPISADRCLSLIPWRLPASKRAKRKGVRERLCLCLFPYMCCICGCALAQRLGQDDSLTNELADRTKADIEIIKKDYMANKDGVLAFINGKVLDVDTIIGPKKVAILRNYAERGVDP